MYQQFGKRIIDVAATFTLLIIFLPIFTLIFILLCFSNKGKPFFMQSRPGLDERLFSIVKFRTMNDQVDGDGNLLSDAMRLTRLGKILRRTSLDELPQLWNVLKGDMSLIGPRPLLEEYLPLYSTSERLRHNVRPGMTGMAQVNGRNTIQWSKKFEYDVFYVSNISFRLDLKIAALTLKYLLVGKRELSIVRKFSGHTDN